MLRGGTAKIHRAPLWWTLPWIYDAWWVPYNTFQGNAAGRVSLFRGLRQGIALASAASTADPALSDNNTTLTFDGTAYAIKGTFTLALPIWYFLVGTQVTWGAKGIVDGATNLSTFLNQNPGSPSVDLYSGSHACQIDNWAIGESAVITCGFNGANSHARKNLGVAVAGNPGSVNPDGITIGSRGGGSSFGNFKMSAFALCRVVLNAWQEELTIRLMAAQTMPTPIIV